MKLVQISDIHISPNPILGSDPVPKFKACLAHVEKYHADADYVAITGDLTHHGEPVAYKMLKEILDGSPLSPALLVGNHDVRGNFRQTFPDVPVDDNGFIQYRVNLPAGRFLHLDTIEPGTHAGHYSNERQAWLRRELDNARSDGSRCSS